MQSMTCLPPQVGERALRDEQLWIILNVFLHDEQLLRLRSQRNPHKRVHNVLTKDGPLILLGCCHLLHKHNLTKGQICPTNTTMIHSLNQRNAFARSL